MFLHANRRAYCALHSDPQMRLPAFVVYGECRVCVFLIEKGAMDPGEICRQCRGGPNDETVILGRHYVNGDAISLRPPALHTETFYRMTRLSKMELRRLAMLSGEIKV